MSDFLCWWWYRSILVFNLFDLLILWLLDYEQGQQTKYVQDLILFVKAWYVESVVNERKQKALLNLNISGCLLIYLSSKSALKTPTWW